MCRRAQCPTCQRPTFKGCGMHVEQVLADVPASERCRCGDVPRAEKAPQASRSWFKRRT